MQQQNNESPKKSFSPLKWLRMWHQNLKDWAWYIKEHPHMLTLDIQSGIRKLYRFIKSSLSRFRHSFHHAKTQSSANQFPESEYLFFKFFLFIWGILPMISALVIESVTQRRKKRSYSHGRINHLLDRLRIHPVIFLSGALCIAAMAVFISLYTLGTSVAYENIDLGIVTSKRIVTNTVHEFEQTTREVLNNPDYAIDTDKLTVTRKVVARRNIEDAATLERSLSEALGDITYAYTLYVDGAPIAATTYANALEGLLEELKIGYITVNTVDCYFAEEVEVREGYIDSTYVMNLGYIAELLYETKQDEIIHVVASGDNYSEIAATYGLTTKQLMALNPGYNTSTLHVGDELLISNAIRYLTVVNVERQSAVTEIPFSVSYQDDASMYQGDYKVLSAGSYGLADVTSNVTYINGTEQSSETVASVTLLDPITEVQARGTVVRPSWYPTGTFSWPCSGTIQSYFGNREATISGMTSNHGALDISNQYGTPIYASDGGTVSHAGWSNGLGYLVIIDHNNGYQTYYGHNSEIFVVEGEHVYKGQMIAAMGSTGISTGVHCHFGIKIYGTAVDPLLYLPER